jgi:hypothetical protein
MDRGEKTHGGFVKERQRRMKKRQPRNGSIYPRGNVYLVKYYSNGQHFRESSHSERYQVA